MTCGPLVIAQLLLAILVNWAYLRIISVRVFGMLWLIWWTEVTSRAIALRWVIVLLSIAELNVCCAPFDRILAVTMILWIVLKTWLGCLSVVSCPC